MNARQLAARLFLTSALAGLVGCGTPDERTAALESGTDANAAATGAPGSYGAWMQQPPESWPLIAMVNRIDYTDGHHPVAGCGFLIDTRNGIVAATAKHVLTYFKSSAMNAIAFEGTLERWSMYPKDRPGEIVLAGSLINEDAEEALPGPRSPSGMDWLLFEVAERPASIQALRLRTDPMKRGEKVFVVGWRYTDVDRPQIVHEGRFIRRDGGSLLIDVEALTENTIPGLSGAPVLGADGYVVGLMSKKAGRQQRIASVDYALEVLTARAAVE